MTRLGPYLLETMIGAGGMGEVWRARDTGHHDRLVALKLLPPDCAGDPDFQERFRREARLAAALRSPHVVPIHSYGEIEGRLYLDMQLIDGTDLSTVLAREGPMAAERAAAIVAQLAGVLDLAHREGLIHRDVKPSNVRLLDDDFVYLLDFGLATRPDTSAATSKAGQVAGTLDYMAPERFGRDKVDHRADIYSLAGLLYACLTGRPPFDTDGLPQALQAHLNWPPPRPSAERPDLPAGFDAVVATGMAKEPGHRYPTAGHLAAATQAVLPGGPGHAAAISAPTRRAGPVVTRPRRLLLGGGAAVLTAAAVTTLVLLTGKEPPAQPVSQSSAPPSTHAAPVVLPPLPSGAVRNVPVGKEPFALAVTPDGRRVYVADEGGGTVTVVDAASDTRVTTIQLSGNPSGIAVTPAGDSVWVAVPQGLQEIDPAANVIRRTVPLAARAYSAAISPDGRFGYTALQRDGIVAEVDLRTGAVTRQLPVAEPAFVALSPDGSTLAVTGFDQPVLTLFDRATGAETARIPFSGGGFAPTFTPDGRGIYLAEAHQPRIHVVDVAARRVTGSVTMKLPAVNVAFAPDGSVAYAHGEDNELTVIDTATASVRRTIPLPADNSASIALAPDGSRVYVLDQDRDTLLVSGLSPG